MCLRAWRPPGPCGCGDAGLRTATPRRQRDDAPRLPPAPSPLASPSRHPCARAPRLARDAVERTSSALATSQTGHRRRSFTKHPFMRSKNTVADGVGAGLGADRGEPPANARQVGPGVERNSRRRPEFWRRRRSRRCVSGRARADRCRPPADAEMPKSRPREHPGNATPRPAAGTMRIHLASALMLQVTDDLNISALMHERLDS